MNPTISITVAPRLIGKTTLTRKGATKGEQNAWKWFLTRQAPGGKPESVEAGNRSSAQRKLKEMIASLLSAGFPVEVEMKDQAHTGFRTTYAIKAGRVEMGPVETIRSTTGVVGPRCHPFPYTKEDQKARAKTLRYVPGAASPVKAEKPAKPAKPVRSVKPAAAKPVKSAKPAKPVRVRPAAAAKPTRVKPGGSVKPAPKPTPARVGTRATTPASARPQPATSKPSVRPVPRVATPVPAPRVASPRAATPVPAPRVATPVPARRATPAPVPPPRMATPAPAPRIPSLRPLPGSSRGGTAVGVGGSYAAPAAPAATLDATALLAQLQASVSAAIAAA